MQSVPQDEEKCEPGPSPAYQDQWTSCLFPGRTTDRRLIQFTSRFVTGLACLVFSMYQLANADPCDSLVPFYCSVVTFVLGGMSTDPRDTSWLRKKDTSS